jgi:hypothetical protein
MSDQSNCSLLDRMMNIQNSMINQDENCLHVSVINSNGSRFLIKEQYELIFWEKVLIHINNGDKIGIVYLDNYDKNDIGKNYLKPEYIAKKLSELSSCSTLDSTEYYKIAKEGLLFSLTEMADKRIKRRA